jgi:uncharacterized protein YecE (DUF72 family)
VETEQRIHRETRRERQRKENPQRARQMHLDRLKFEQKCREKAPQGNPNGKNLEPKCPKPHALRRRLWIGCSGWYYRDWGNGLYKDIPDNRWFAHYASQFPTVELNAPFYSWPKLATVKTWLRQVRDLEFAYAIKVNQLITHQLRFLRTRKLVEDFNWIADLLGPHFGCFLFQLPPSYRYNAAALRRIVSQLDPKLRNVVEFRHKSWWNEKVFAAFRERGIIFCSSSGPGMPDQLVKTADDVYIRFHGLEKWYRHDYADHELAIWAERIRECKARRVWAYFNNDHNGYAIKNARELGRLLKDF